MTEITVVIPVWDGYVEWLPRAAASLDRQGTAVRLVVVDNASSVAVPALPRAATLRLARRLSVGAARNAGLAEVRTPLVCFLDADDQLLPGTLGRLQARMAARPSCVAAVPACEAWADTTGETVLWAWPRRLAYRLCRHRRLFTLAAALRNAYPTTGALIDVAMLRAAGGFADSDHEEDWLPAVALAARGHIELDREHGRRCRVSGESLYGAGADFSTMRANRRALRQALRRDPSTRTLALVAGWALAAAHLASAFVKAAPRRRGHARLLSAAGGKRQTCHSPSSELR